MILALIPSYFLAKYERVGLVVMSTICGALFGLLIDLLLSYGGGLAAYFSLITIPAVAAGVCSFIFHDKFIVLMTSFIGSYKVIRGISYFAKGFPDEIEQLDLVKLHDIITPYYSKAYYGYFPGILILFILSTVFQFWKKSIAVQHVNASDPKAVYYENLGGSDHQ